MIINDELQIKASSQNANGGTLILGNIGKLEEFFSHLRLGYHNDYSWIQSSKWKPLAINPLGNNVGIGIDDPQARLHIIGKTGDTIAAPTLIIGPADQSHLRLGYHNDYSWVQSSKILALNPDGNKVEIGTSNSQVELKGKAMVFKMLTLIEAEDPGDDPIPTVGPYESNRSHLRLGYHNDYSWIQSSERRPLAINPVGNNVGVGTSDPSGKLHIISEAGDAIAAPALVLGPADQSHLRMGYHNNYSWIQSSKVLALNPIRNNVGIGTDDPRAKLHIINRAGSPHWAATLILGPADQSNLRLGYHNDYSWVQSSKTLALNPAGNQVDIGSGDYPVWLKGAVIVQSKMNIIGKPNNPDKYPRSLVIGPDDATKSHLGLGYGNDYCWIQSFGSVPLALNPMGNKVEIGRDNNQVELKGDVIVKSKMNIINEPNDPNQYSATLVLGPRESTKSHLELGYNSNYGWIQSSEGPLELNPQGKEVRIGYDLSVACKISSGGFASGLVSNGRIAIKDWHGNERIILDAASNTVSTGYDSDSMKRGQDGKLEIKSDGGLYFTIGRWKGLDYSNHFGFHFITKVGLEIASIIPLLRKEEGEKWDHAGCEINVGSEYESADKYAGRINLYDEKGSRSILIDGRSGKITTRNADCAEEFEISDTDSIDPGSVVVIDQEGKLRLCAEEYDKKVVGVVSGAGDLAPGLVMGRNNNSEKTVPITLIGRVFCKVDAQFGSIDAGDLLTTSRTRGHAMKVSEPSYAFGATIGKALQALSSGKGLILMLSALQ